MEIPENMDQWNVLEKMEQWDTSTTTDDDIVKDLNPYVECVLNKLKAVLDHLNPHSPYLIDELNALDDTILNDLDVLKKIQPRIEPFYRNLQTEVGESAKVYRLAMEAILQLPGHSHYKLKKMLNDQTGLTKDVKERILEVWEKNHSRHHCWCLPSNDTTLMEECIRTNNAIMYDVSDKEEELTRRYDAFHKFWLSTNWAINIFSSHLAKRCENAKHEKLKSTSSPKASGHQLKMCESTKHKRLKSTSSPKASGQ